MKTTLRFGAIVALALASLTALAAPLPGLSMSGGQLQTVCTAVKAAPTANAARLAGDTVTLLEWLNAARTPTVLSWRADVLPQQMHEAANYTGFDALAAGKRDTWGLVLRFTTDSRKNKNRNTVVDVWGPATSGSVAEAVLLASTTPATNTQAAIGGTSKTTGTVTATDFGYTGPADKSDATWLVQAENCN